MIYESKERIFRQAVSALVALVIIIILVLTFFLLENVRKSKDAEAPPTYNGKIITFRGVDITVFEFDSCQYIETSSGVTHKGNCKYCAARAAQK